MKIIIVSILSMILLLFQNCEIVQETNAEGEGKTYVLDSISIDGNLSDVSFTDFNFGSQQSAPEAGMITEYRVNPETGEVSVFSSGEKTDLCMTDLALEELQDFIAHKKFCVKTLIQDETDPIMCTMEYRYGVAVFNLLEPQAANIYALNVEGTNGCGVDIDFCSDSDRNEFIKIKGDIKTSPPGSCN